MKITSKYYKQVTVSDPITGAPVAPTSITAIAYKDNVSVATTFPLTVTAVGGTTGLYAIATTDNETFFAGGFAEGNKVEILVTATISAIAYLGIVDSFEIETEVKLAADGLDSITNSEPAVWPPQNLKDVIGAIYRWCFNKKSATTTEIKLYADDDETVVTTQPVGYDGITKTVGKPE